MNEQLYFHPCFDNQLHQNGKPSQVTDKFVLSCFLVSVKTPQMASCSIGLTVTTGVAASHFNQSDKSRNGSIQTRYRSKVNNTKCSLTQHAHSSLPCVAGLVIHFVQCYILVFKQTILILRTMNSSGFNFTFCFCIYRFAVTNFFASKVWETIHW